jgi:hypothetical protein
MNEDESRSGRLLNERVSVPAQHAERVQLNKAQNIIYNPRAKS